MFGGFLDNIDKTLKVGGIFVGTNFDGEAVFNLLKDTKTGETKVGMDSGSTLWEITKQYSAEDLPNDSSAFGMAVDVKFVTIGMSHIEYLVPWELLVSKMKSIGCELADATTLATMGLKSSTNMYRSSYDNVLKGGNKELYTIKSDAAKQFSFLNRWYVFKRVSKGGEAPVVVEMEADTPVATDGPAAADTPAAAAPAEAPILEPTPAFTVAPSGILTQKKYELNEVFNFKEDSLPIDKKLKLPDAYTEYAARWLAPNAPFRIVEGGDEYPSITHFLAGMKFKYASSKPELANEFSNEGRIHQEFNGKRVSQRDPKKGLDKKIHYKLLEEETVMIEAEAKKELRKNKTAYDESKWNTLKDKYLREAIQQRLRIDKWFCIIVTAAIDQNKYLLYVDKETSELGGVRKADKTIKGDNKYGRYILEEAYQSPDFIKACVASGKEPPV
jgi:hypothetical protein